MLYTTSETRAHMLQHMDKYSDNFTIDATEESLREVFHQMDKDGKGEEEDSQREDEPSETKLISILPSFEILGMPNNNGCYFCTKTFLW